MPINKIQAEISQAVAEDTVVNSLAISIYKTLVRKELSVDQMRRVTRKVNAMGYSNAYLGVKR